MSSLPSHRVAVASAITSRECRRARQTADARMAWLQVLAALSLCLGGTLSAPGETINIDAQRSSDPVYSGSDGVLSSGGTYWNNSATNANLKNDAGVATTVDLVLLQWLGSVSPYSSGHLLLGDGLTIGTSVGNSVIYNLQELDPYKTYDIAVYYGYKYGTLQVVHESGTVLTQATVTTWSGTLPGTEGAEYLRVRALKPYEISSGVYGFKLYIYNTTWQDYVSGIEIKDTGTRTNISPHAASLLFPTNGATGIALTPTLQASAFSDPDIGDAHANTQWQITTNSWLSPAWDSGTNYAASSSVPVPPGVLASARTYYWRVRYKDASGNWSPLSATFNFTTAGGNSAPTNMLLSGTNVAENLAGGATVGVFSAQDPDAGNTFVYTLTNGTGGADNASFTISGSNLLTAVAFNYEARNTYSVRVQATDQGGLATQMVFAINVTNVNEAPTNILLSGTNVAENLPPGTTVGSFSTQDPDAGSTSAYALTNGTGGADNGSFAISGSNLLASVSFNYEVKSSYSIRVQSTDAGGLSTQMVFAISVTDVDERPVFYGPSEPTNGSMVLRWSSVTNHSYTIHYSTNLLAGFSVLQSNIPATPAINTYTDSTPAIPQKCWKITTDP